MLFIPIRVSFAAAMLVPALACAQAFPDAATVPGAADIQQRLGGRVFKVQLADGSSWRLEYKSNGYFFVNTSSGFADTGTWTAEDGRLCSHRRKGSGPGCNDVRVHEDALLLKRDSGEIIRYLVQ